MFEERAVFVSFPIVFTRVSFFVGKTAKHTERSGDVAASTVRLPQSKGKSDGAPQFSV